MDVQYFIAIVTEEWLHSQDYPGIELIQPTIQDCYNRLAGPKTIHCLYCDHVCNIWFSNSNGELISGYLGCIPIDNDANNVVCR